MLLSKENGWFEALKVFERPSLIHTVPATWSATLGCFMEQSQLYSLTT